MECRKEQNTTKCNCSYDPCSRKGICCECLHYHRGNGEIPACYFPNNIERGYDRSIDNFIKVYKERKHL